MNEIVRRNPLNVKTERIGALPPEELRVGHVTLYGIILGLQPVTGGVMIDHPHNTRVFAEEGTHVVVLCAVPPEYATFIAMAYAKQEQ